jgi:hypothetical protein
VFESLQSQIITILKSKILDRYESHGAPAQRDQHTKQHGCLRAEFIVEDLPLQFRVGLFKEPKVFPAWVRFSNAREVDDDRKKDVRGMAIKVMEVPGEKVLADAQAAETQDFLLVNHPVFFVNHLSDYPQVLDYKGCPLANAVPLLKFYLVFGRHQSRKREWQVLQSMFKKLPISSLLTTEYFSMTPYAFGEAAVTGISAVKYVITPAAGNVAAQERKGTENYLQESMEQFLSQEGKDAYFDFCIQLQENPEEMPIENPTIEWKAEKHKLATIKIPSQAFNSPQRREFSENLSFTPWHSLVEHQPLGEMNRLRKQVYQQTAEYRREELNHITPQEPTATTQEPELPNYDETYRWVNANARYPGAPPYVEGLPLGEDFPGYKLFVFLGTAIATILGILNAQFLHLLSFVGKKILQGKFVLRKIADFNVTHILAGSSNWGKLDDFQSFFKPWTFLTKPRVSEIWSEDVEFGRQRLAGLNPVVIRAYRPEDFAEGEFPITEELLKPILSTAEKDFNFAEALQQERLYVLDYRIFAGILSPVQEDQIGRYTAASVTLFYLNAADQLIPCAIQLKPNSYRGSTEVPQRIFTPQSSPETWALAKVVVAASDTAYHGIVSHLIETHLVSEMFAVSTCRVFSKEHVLYKMLKPHFFNTIAINYMARTTAFGFLGRGRLFDKSGALGYSGSNELLSRAYSGRGLMSSYSGQQWEFYQAALPKRLAERGVNHLSAYHYRADALLVWEAIQAYVSNILKAHYPTSESLQADRELQAWIQDLTSPEGANLQGLVEDEAAITSLNSVETLIEIVTNVIFTATAQHAAVNFGHYDYAGWVPNMPFALYKPLDALFDNNPGAIDLVQWLPDRSQSLRQITLMKTLSLLPPYTSHSLLTMPNPYKVGSSESQTFLKFRARLQEIDQQIGQRNDALRRAGQIPYEYLRPSRIPQSVAI